MRLCKLKAFRNLIYAPDGAPSLCALRAQISAGTMPGGLVLGGRYYVDLDAFDHATGLSVDLREQVGRLEKSPDLEGLI